MAKQKREVLVQVRVAPETHRQLRAQARREELSIAALVRTLIRRHLETRAS